jgi:hypothetical protein
MAGCLLVEEFRLVFVGGMGRSGSTLVERLLGELPGVCSVGEVVHMWRRSLVDNEACGCGVPFGDCGFWRAVGDRAYRGWDRVDVDEILALKESVDRMRFVPSLLRTRPPRDLAARIERYTELYHRLYAAIASVSGCRVVVDASKHGSLAACLWQRYAARFQVVHMVRDPRAVAYAWTKQVPRPEATATSPEQEMARYSPGVAAAQWVAQNSVFAALARRGVPTHRVRYEDFVARPVEEFRAVAAFVGHRGAVPLGADQVARLSSTHAVSGNPMRFTTGAVAVRADARWHDDLGSARRLVVSTLTAPSRWRYGY